MISSKRLLCAVLLVGAVEGSRLQQQSSDNVPSNESQNRQAANHQRSFQVSYPPNNSVTRSISVDSLNNTQSKSDQNIVVGKPVSGGAKTPLFPSELIIRQPIKNEENSPRSDDDFISSVLEVAARKVNDTDFLRAIKSIEDHIERRVNKPQRTSSTPTSGSLPSPITISSASNLSGQENIGTQLNSQTEHNRQSIEKKTTLRVNKALSNNLNTTPLQQRESGTTFRVLTENHVLRSSNESELTQSEIQFNKEKPVMRMLASIAELAFKSTKPTVNDSRSKIIPLIPEIIVGQKSDAVITPTIIIKKIINTPTEISEADINVTNSPISSNFVSSRLKSEIQFNKEKPLMRMLTSIAESAIKSTKPSIKDSRSKIIPLNPEIIVGQKSDAVITPTIIINKIINTPTEINEADTNVTNSPVSSNVVSSRLKSEIQFNKEKAVMRMMTSIAQSSIKSTKPSVNDSRSKSIPLNPDIIVGQPSNAVSTPTIIIKKIINTPTEINEADTNVANSPASSNVASSNLKSLENNTGRPTLKSFSHSTNEGQRKIMIVPSNINLSTLKKSFPQFNFQDLRPAKLITSTSLGNRTTGNLLVRPIATTDLNNKSAQKSLTQSSRHPIKQLSNQPTIIKSLTQQNLPTNQQTNNLVIQTHQNLLKQGIARDNLSSTIDNITPSKDTSIDSTNINQSEFDQFIQNIEQFSLQSENSPDSNINAIGNNIFTPPRNSFDISNDLSAQSIHSSIPPKKQHIIENTITQSPRQINSVSQSIYPGPQEIAQFINSVQPTLIGDLETDIIRFSLINKDQTHIDPVQVGNNKLRNGRVFEKSSSFGTDFIASFSQPTGFNQEHFSRPSNQPLQVERLSNTKNTRFIDDVQLSHIQPNPAIFQETSRVRTMSQFKNKHSPSNDIFPTRSQGNTFSLSGFGEQPSHIQPNPAIFQEFRPLGTVPQFQNKHSSSNDIFPTSFEDSTFSLSDFGEQPLHIQPNPTRFQEASQVQSVPQFKNKHSQSTDIFPNSFEGNTFTPSGFGEQFSHIQPNPTIFQEVSRLHPVPQFQNIHSPPNGIIPNSFESNEFSLSGFGTNQPGVDLAAFDPQIRLSNQGFTNSEIPTSRQTQDPLNSLPTSQIGFDSIQSVFDTSRLDGHVFESDETERAGTGARIARSFDSSGKEIYGIFYPQISLQTAPDQT